MNEHTSSADAMAWMLAGGGASADLIRRVDWATTPLGPMAAWSRSLKSTVAILLHSRHPMFLWWGRELIQIYNDAYVPSFGLGKHPAAMGQPGRECWPEIWQIIGPQIEAVMTHGTPSWHEDALVPIFRNGAIEDVYWTYGYSPVFDDDGTIGGTLVVCTETTERVLATRREQAMRADVERERRRLEQFFAQAPAGICILRGPALTFEFANDHYRALVGGRSVVGQPLLDALPELRGQGLDGLLRDVLATGTPFVGREVRLLIDRQGRGAVDEAYYTFVYSPLRDSTSSVDAVIVLALDVTDEVAARRQTDELSRKLQDSEAQFHQLAESIPQLAWAARPDGFVEWYNQRWYEYTGTTLESMQGWGWQSVHDPERIDEVVARWRACVESGAPFEMEFTLRGRDGVLRWHLTRAIPLRDDSGQIVRWFGTCTDVDLSRRIANERDALLEKERHARQTAEFASRAKDDFLSTASHELRTPLNAMLGWARMLQNGQLDGISAKRAVESIERNARAQVRLVEDILDGSRIITGKLHLDVRPVDLAPVLHAAIDAVRAAAEAKEIALTVELAADVPQMTGDADRLQQVIWNLVNNAIKFTPKHGAVAVSLCLDHSDLMLRVTDSGDGIDRDFLPHVFERFRQAESSTTRRYGGLGLGLALARHLVEAHGGTIRADSEGPGCGATFTVTLPVRAVFAPLPEPGTVTAVAEPPVVRIATSLHGLTVLVVDDEPDARDLVATALTASGAEVATAGNATEALELVASGRFNAMVSDVGMPGTDGYDLVAAIRRVTGASAAHLPAIALTAYSRDQDRRRALAAGFQAYLAKPVDPDVLVQLVADLRKATRPL
ncbi:MAG: PAS domain-containing protein [Vicinamibacterales bacterium]